ncbi:MAG: hypothetical protein KAV42_01050 [Candidatus Krumholzibacteria bacterium]|nr:hypothetical protein [Candidatus Krumholzibacteria bacterium]
MLIGTAMAFVASGVDSWQCGLIFLAIGSFLTAAINILASFFVLKHPLRTDVTLFFINAAFAALTSYTFFQVGKDKLPYAWAGVCGLYLIAPFVKIYRARLKERKSGREEIERKTG